MNTDKIKKIVSSVIGVLLILPTVLAALGVIAQDEVSVLVENIGNLGAAITAAITAVAGIYLVFTNGDPSINNTGL